MGCFSEFRKKILSNIIGLRSISFDTLRRILNKLVNPPFELLIRKPRLLFISPSVLFSFPKFNGTTQEKVINYKKINRENCNGLLHTTIGSNRNNLRIYYDPSITSKERIIKDVSNILDNEPLKVEFLDSLCNIPQVKMDRVLVYALNLSKVINIRSFSKISVKCPINLHPDCYRIIQTLYENKGPLSINSIGEKISKDTRMISDRIVDLEPFSLVLKIKQIEGPALFDVNYAHYLINKDPYINT